MLCAADVGWQPGGASPIGVEVTSEPEPLLRTFLFTDIEGSTVRWESDPAAMRAALGVHDRIIHGAVTAHRGRVFKHTGDGVVAVFESAAQAVTAALESQLQLGSAVWPSASPLRVRMGVYTGEATVRVDDADDWEGATLSRASRLEDAANGGQIFVSAATEMLVRHRLPESCALLSVGHFELRGSPDAEEIFQLCHPDLEANPAAPRARSREPSPALPRPLTSFIGRQRDVKAVAELVSHHRVVSVVGPGGVGKTRLVGELSSGEVEFPGGAWTCELAPVVAGADVVEHIATCLGARERDPRGVFATIARTVGQSRMLIVLDNCEHVLDQARQFVTSLVRDCAQVHVLLTSREPLSVPGEHTWLISPLDVPPAGHSGVDACQASEAVRLFIDRATAVRPDFQLDSGNAEQVADICRRLDGIPLAIELAAARTQSLAPADLRTLLDQRFRLLAPPEADPRRTLWGAVDWSYELLNPVQRRTFRKLSVFAGGWTLDAATAVCEEELVDRLDVVDVLAELVRKSLVASDLSGGSTRYRMLETLKSVRAGAAHRSR